MSMRRYFAMCTIAVVIGLVLIGIETLKMSQNEPILQPIVCKDNETGIKYYSSIYKEDEMGNIQIDKEVFNKKDCKLLR